MTEKPLGKKGRNLVGETFGEWCVVGPFRRHIQPCGQAVIQWWCRCSCEARSWISARDLTHGLTTKCSASVHRAAPAIPVGLVQRAFTVLEVFCPGGRKERNSYRVRCMCGRERMMGHCTLFNLNGQRNSCGCVEGDSPWLEGASELPPGVSTYHQLIQWAGISRQGHYLNISKHGLEEALTRLTRHAEKNHPGEGWRIKALVPVPTKKEA